MFSFINKKNKKINWKPPFDIKEPHHAKAIVWIKRQNVEKKKNHVNVTHKTQAQWRPDSGGEGQISLAGIMFSLQFSPI